MSSSARSLIFRHADEGAFRVARKVAGPTGHVLSLAELLIARERKCFGLPSWAATSSTIVARSLGQGLKLHLVNDEHAVCPKPGRPFFEVSDSRNGSTLETALRHVLPSFDGIRIDVAAIVDRLEDDLSSDEGARFRLQVRLDRDPAVVSILDPEDPAILVVATDRFDVEAIEPLHLRRFVVENDIRQEPFEERAFARLTDIDGNWYTTYPTAPGHLDSEDACEKVFSCVRVGPLVSMEAEPDRRPLLIYDHGEVMRRAPPGANAFHRTGHVGMRGEVMEFDVAYYAIELDRRFSYVRPRDLSDFAA